MHDLVGMDHRVQRTTRGRRPLLGLVRCGRLNTDAACRDLGKRPAGVALDATAGGTSLADGVRGAEGKEGGKA